MIDFQLIVQELVKSGMSQSEIARLVGTTQPTIHRIMTGETRTPCGNTAIALVSLRDQRQAA